MIKLTTNQIAWARNHEWFLCDNGDGTITVCDAYMLDGKLHEDPLLWTESFSALRAWAGY